MSAAKNKRKRDKRKKKKKKRKENSPYLCRLAQCWAFLQCLTFIPAHVEPVSQGSEYESLGSSHGFSEHVSCPGHVWLSKYPGVSGNLQCPTSPEYLSLSFSFQTFSVSVVCCHCNLFPHSSRGFLCFSLFSRNAF